MLMTLLWHQHFSEPITVNGIWTLTSLGELSAGSEITLTIAFNSTLPAGNYCVMLSSWHDSHGSSPFTIP